MSRCLSAGQRLHHRGGVVGGEREERERERDDGRPFISLFSATRHDKIGRGVVVDAAAQPSASWTTLAHVIPIVHGALFSLPIAQNHEVLMATSFVTENKPRNVWAAFLQKSHPFFTRVTVRICVRLSVSEAGYGGGIDAEQRARAVRRTIHEEDPCRRVRLSARSNLATACCALASLASLPLSLPRSVSHGSSEAQLG